MQLVSLCLENGRYEILTGKSHSQYTRRSNVNLYTRRSNVNLYIISLWTVSITKIYKNSDFEPFSLLWILSTLHLMNKIVLTLHLNCIRYNLMPKISYVARNHRAPLTFKKHVLANTSIFWRKILSTHLFGQQLLSSFLESWMIWKIAKLHHLQNFDIPCGICSD